MMKAIFALFLIVCSTQAFSFNAEDFSDYHEGFYAELGLNPDQDVTVYNCGQGIYNLVADLVSLFKVSGKEELFFAATQFIGDIKYQTLADCEAYKTYLTEYIQQNAVIANGSNLEQTIIKNIETYAPELIQQVAIWGHDMATENYYLAGQTQATIMDMEIGEDVIPTQTPELNITKFTPFNATTFYSQFYGAFYGALNFTNQTAINTFTQCGLEINTLVDTIIELRQEFKQADGFYDEVAAASQAFDALLHGITQCHEAFELEEQFAATFIQELQASPLLTIVKLVYNVASNLPELIHNQLQMVVNIEQGEYDLAGGISAQQDLIVFQGLVNFTQFDGIL